MADRARSELVALLACCQAMQDAGLPWWQLARAVERAGSVLPLLAGPWEPADRWEYEVAAALARHLRHGSLEVWGGKLSEWLEVNSQLRFITILDEAYPPSLRLIFNPPPFLTLRGDLAVADMRGVAVVGTRQPSPEGVRRARRLARELASAGITVFSGLAKGIDTAAHQGAIDAGGRTVGVVGHGLLRPVYPAENRGLAEAISSSGALVSQFRPDTPPSRSTFPMRNAVMSGLSQGTVVVEASHTSGARLQARLAAEHGKRVWLLESLVADFPWAREFHAKYSPSTRVISDVSEVLEEIRTEGEIAAAASRHYLPPVPSAEEARRPGAEPMQLFALGA